MKYDVWPRFLKSEFAQKRSAVTEKDRSGSMASLSGDPKAADSQEKQSKRKSLIPWKGKFIASRRKKEGRPEVTAGFGIFYQA